MDSSNEVIEDIQELNNKKKLEININYKNLNSINNSKFSMSLYLLSYRNVLCRDKFGINKFLKIKAIDNDKLNISLCLLSYCNIFNASELSKVKTESIGIQELCSDDKVSMTSYFKSFYNVVKIPKVKLRCNNQKVAPKFDKIILRNLLGLDKVPLSVKEINMCNLNLTELPNLSRFKKLHSLDCSNNRLTKLTNLPANLKNLFCTRNLITELTDLPKKLARLYCDNNKIIRLSNLPNTLTVISCAHNEILELSDLPKSLTSLLCNYNKLNTLYNLPDTLVILDYSNNKLVKLNNLFVLNKLKCLNCSGNEITKLDSLPINLLSFVCSDNKLTELLNLPKNLKHLWCSNNMLTKLINLPEFLESLYCSHNKLTELTKLPDSLKVLWCNDSM